MILRCVQNAEVRPGVTPRTAGISKQDHQKRACLMEAICEANRKDAQGTPVVARLNTVNLVKEGSEFNQWLTAMRIEA